MKVLIGALAGLLWGAAAAFLNARVSAAIMKKETVQAAMAANFARLAVDIAALAAVLLLRGVLPFPYEPALIGAAVSLSTFTLINAFRMGKK